jgi:DNA-directed RNA polymerase specialized sigma24 family protein
MRRLIVYRNVRGPDNDEMTKAMGVSLATVKRDWTVARAWLQRELAGG